MFVMRMACSRDLASVVAFYQTVEQDAWQLPCKPQCLMEPVMPSFLEDSIAHGELFLGYWNDLLVSAVVVNHHPHPEFQGIPWTVELDDAAVGIIHCLAVLPSYQKLGKGRELLQAVSRRLRTQGIKVLRYDVLKGDIPLQHLVAQSGFRFCALVQRRLCDHKRYPYGMYELLLDRIR